MRHKATRIEPRHAGGPLPTLVHLAMTLVTASLASLASFGCGEASNATDGAPSGAGHDAAPVACESDDDCQTPPDACLLPGSCGDTGVCSFPERACDTPPSDECVDDNTTHRTYVTTGTCSAESGECVYGFTDTPCDQCAETCLGGCDGISCPDENGGCRISGTCVIEDGNPVCKYDDAAEGASCDLDGEPGKCSGGACFECIDAGDCDDGNACTDDICDGGSCSNPPVENGTSCGSGNCGSCSSGTCTTDQDLCSGNCAECRQTGSNTFRCQKDESACTGNCSECSGSGTTFTCGAKSGVCTGCSECKGSGTSFNCGAQHSECSGNCNRCNVSGTSGTCAKSDSACTGCAQCVESGSGTFVCAAGPCDGTCGTCSLSGTSGTCEPNQAACGGSSVCECQLGSTGACNCTL